MMRIISLLLLQCLWSLLCAQTRPFTPQFESLNHVEDLPSVSVMTTFQDSRGFIWVGAYAGLFRYDGYETVQYFHDPADPYSIGDSKVLHITEDRNGDLWFGTQVGLNFFDRKTERFTRFYADVDGENGSGLPNNWISGFWEDIFGNIWVTTSVYLCRFYQEDGCFECYSTSDSGFARAQFYGIHDEKPGRLWLAGTTGLFTFDIEQRIFSRINLADEKEDRLLQQPIWAIQEDGRGKLWLGTSNGMMEFDPEKKSIRRFPLAEQDSYGNEGNRIIMVEDDLIWAATFRGIAQLSVSDSTYVRLTSADEDPFSLNYDQITGFSKDHSGNIWVSSHKGINQLKPTTGVFLKYPHIDIQYAPGPANLRGFYEIAPGQLLLAQKDGLKIFHWREGVYSDFPYQPTMHLDEWREGVICFFADDKDAIWMGGLGCVFIFNRDDRTYSYLELRPDGFPIYIRDILRDHTGLVWIATWREGVYCFNPETGVLTNYFRENKNSFNKLTRNLYEDNSGTLWLGTRGGLNRYDRARDTFFLHERKLGDPHSMSENTAFDIYEDEEGYLWIGTYGGGLNRFDRNTERFRHYTIADGLPSNHIFSIQPDRHGKLWFSTSRGIASYDPKKETFEAFDRRDGLLNKSYYAFSYYQSPYTGHLFYEGEDGLDIFHPDSIQKDLTPPRIAFTDLLLYNQSVPIARTAAELSSKDTFYLAQSITETKQLTLPYAQKVITFEFAALHYLNPSKNQYAYKLIGFDRDWQYIGAQRTATFTNLSPGAYTFMVKAANSHGFWNEEPATIQLTITPPWWLTWPAYFLYGLLVGLGFYAYYRYQRRQWRLQTQLALEQEEAKRLKEMDETKTRLYTNITHEFRTPLTVISGMAEQIGREPEKWLRKGTEMIRRNSEHLVELINQVLDLRKLESNKMPAQFIQGNIVDYLRYLSESHESLAANRDIDLDFSSDTPQILMDYDPEKMRRILSNLLSNAVKFTPAGGRVRVQVSRRDEAGRAHLQMAVSDTGAGIPPEKLPYIFDRFYQADDSATRKAEGTGIGLALVRELVKLLGGTIAVDSREGEGSVFTVLLPIYNRAPRKEAAEEILEKITPAAAKPALQSETIAAEALLSEDSERPTLLIIEDNADVQQYLRTILESGYHLLTAADGQAGIDQALEHVPDIIISDIMMPVKDGFEVCRTLKEDERTSHIPIILLTARADRDSRLEGLERGADAYLPKPFYPEELQIRLRKLVELRERMRRRYAAMEPLPPTADPDLQKEDEFILRARAFVEQNIGNAEFSLHDLCRELAVSRTQLHNKLKALSGRSTTAFIRIIRLQRARKLLAETDLNVSEAAYEVGFNDPNYFSRRYFEAFGVRPGDETSK